MAGNTILPSRNEAWGFWGTAARGTDPGTAWGLAFLAVRRATGAEPEAVRAFLDGIHGRHFADEALGNAGWGKPLGDGIDAAVAKWMGWSIGRRTSRRTGIPAGLPYLSGMVEHHGILAEGGAGADAEAGHEAEGAR